MDLGTQEVLFILSQPLHEFTSSLLGFFMNDNLQKEVFVNPLLFEIWNISLGGSFFRLVTYLLPMAGR